MSRKIRVQKIFRVEFVVNSIDQEEIEERSFLESATEFDQEGNLLAEVTLDRNGDLVEKYVRKYLGNQKSTEEYYIVEEELSEKTEYEYDAENRPLREIKTFADGLIQTTTYSYENGKIKSIITADPEDGESSRLIYEWASDGLSVSEKLWEYQELKTETIKKFNGQDEIVYKKLTVLPEMVVVEEFMTFNNDLLAEYVRKADFVADSNSQYSYDSKGNLIGIIYNNEDRKGSIALEYDDQGRATKEVEIDENESVLNEVERHYYPETGFPRATLVYSTNRVRNINEQYRLEYEYELWPE